MAEPKLIVKARVTPYFTLVLDGEDGVEPREWRLCYDYKAVAKIEEATGLDIKKYDDWQTIRSGKHFPTIVWGGLNRYNPEVTLDEVVDILNPECQTKLWEVIFDLLYPGVKEAWEKAQAEAKAIGATARPNVQTAPLTD